MGYSRASAELRKRAKELGLRTYSTGKPCKHGHVSKRYLNGGGCLQCHEVGERPRKLTPRQIAKELGLKRYSTGKPCINGHVMERRVSDMTCLGCRSESPVRQADNPDKAREKKLAYNKRWRAANPDKRAAQDKRYCDRYPDKLRAKKTRWNAANPEKVIVLARMWRANNPDKLRANSHRRKIRKRGNGGTYTPKDIQKIYAEQGGKCAYHRHCGTVLTPLGIVPHNRHEDHIVSVKRGGSNNPHNIQILCQPCNNRKSAKSPIKHGLAIGVLSGKIAYAHILALMGVGRNASQHRVGRGRPRLKPFLVNVDARMLQRVTGPPRRT